MVADASSTFADVEAWAEHYVRARDLATKLAPGAPPRTFRDGAEPLRLEAPGRPPELRPATRRERTPRPDALREPAHRARMLHTFLHHELQAAELMCWAILTFADAELDFRKGLLGICQDELRHMALYRAHIEKLGFEVGSFGVRDWFWHRVPACRTPIDFVAVMGMGFEAANLEHAATFAARFRAAGDAEGAALQERVGLEEIAHVSFAIRWFARWTGGLDFDTWVSHLPAPLSPWVLRGEPVAHGARARAGMPDAFVRALEAYVPEPRVPSNVGRAAPRSRGA